MPTAVRAMRRKHARAAEAVTAATPALVMVMAALMVMSAPTLGGCTAGEESPELDDPTAEELLDLASAELNAHVTQIDVDQGRLIYDGPQDTTAEYRTTPQGEELLFRAREADRYIWLASPSPPEWRTATAEDLRAAAEQAGSDAADADLEDLARTTEVLLELDAANPFRWMLLLEPDGPVETTDSEGTPFAVTGNVGVPALARSEFIAMLEQAEEQTESEFLPDDWSESGIRLRIWFNPAGTPVRLEAGTYGPGDIPADVPLRTIFLDRIEEGPQLPENPTPYP